MAQLLARHSDYKTTERYTHLALHDKGSAAAKLSPLLPQKKPEREELRATGTLDHRPAESSETGQEKKVLSHACHGIGTRGHFGAQSGTDEKEVKAEPATLKIAENPEKTGENERMGRDSNPRWTCAQSSFQDCRLSPLGHPS